MGAIAERVRRDIDQTKPDSALRIGATKGCARGVGHATERLAPVAAILDTAEAIATNARLGT